MQFKKRAIEADLPRTADASLLSNNEEIKKKQLAAIKRNKKAFGAFGQALGGNAQLLRILINAQTSKFPKQLAWKVSEDINLKTNCQKLR